MKVSKKLVVILSSTLLFAACGNGGEKSKGDTTAAAPKTAAADDKALELIGANDCTTCHRIHKEDNGANTGPSYSEVADKYSPAADSTVDRLVKKIQNGGTGVWGTSIMTPHTQVPEADIREMVKYILSLKK